MGCLTQWTIPPEFVARFPIFVETGVGNGTSLAYAALHGFERLFSLELEPNNYARAIQRFECDPRVTILQGKSVDLLHTLLTTNHDCARRGVFFFLDAHFASGDIQDDPRDLDADVEAWVPLHEELRRIRNLRPDGNYAVLIDDLKLFVNVGDGVPSPDSYVKRHVQQGFEFLDPFHKSHILTVHHEDGGFAFLMPDTPRIHFRGDTPNILK